MEFKELNKKTESELNRILKEEKGKLRDLIFDLSSGKVKNVREIRVIKKDIAQILTIFNARKKNE